MKSPAATGNPWIIDHKESEKVTVPVPKPVIMVKVDGPFRERERKLWTFLLHAVAHEIDEKRVHELPATDVWRVFNRLGGDRNKEWLWEALASLSQAHVTFEGVDEGDARYRTITRLISAVRLTEGKGSDTIRFEFPQMLIDAIKQPLQYARIRTHHLLTLSGKYAVTLYEILEGIANQKHPCLEVSVAELRLWLKVPEGKLKRWNHFHARCLEPAVREINSNPYGSGFEVFYELIRGAKSKVKAIRFEVKKTASRLKFEDSLQGLRKRAVACSFAPATYEKAKKLAPGCDVYALEIEWREWKEKKGKKGRQVENEEAAYLGFCKKKSR
ncbi:MAG: replication initiation protein [Cyanothece sp. SIO1E1]|nr:replication initiation protein [Cyanothece sp. SIO1E1]